MTDRREAVTPARNGAPGPVSVGTHTLLLACPGRESALRDWLERHGTLMAAAEAHAGAVALEGRGRVAVVPSPESAAASSALAAAASPSVERWVVRHYHRGGAVAGRLGDRYLRVGIPRPFRELRMLEAVRALGVPAPEPVGAAVHAAGPFYRGDLATRWVPGSMDLATLLFGAAGTSGAVGLSEGKRGHDDDSCRAAMEAAGRLVRILHDRGVDHPDLNLKNILLASPGSIRGADVSDGGDAELRALVLDLDRARLYDGPVGARARRRMLDRLWRSARKWERRTGRLLPLPLRRAFETGYEAGVAAQDDQRNITAPDSPGPGPAGSG
jgi:hypothetical protein